MHWKSLWPIFCKQWAIGRPSRLRAAIAVLIIGVVVLAAMAQALLVGFVIVVCAVALWIVRAVTARQAQATREIASALVETEES